MLLGVAAGAGEFAAALTGVTAFVASDAAAPGLTAALEAGAAPLVDDGTDAPLTGNAAAEAGLAILLGAAAAAAEGLVVDPDLTVEGVEDEATGDDAGLTAAGATEAESVGLITTRE